MQGRLGRVSIAATLLCTLLIPAAGSFAEPSKLEKIEAELGEVRKKIDPLEAKAEPLQAEVDSINADMMALRDEIAKLDERIAAVEADVRNAQALIDSTQRKIDRIEDLASEQAVALYKAGSTETIDALLNAESISELDARVEMLGVAAQESTGALIKYGRLQVEVEAQHRNLFEKKAELEAIRKEHSKAYALSDKLHDRLAEKLAILERKLGHLHAAEGDLEDAAASIISRIRSSSSSTVGALGESTAGFIWPINGAITSYYGPRWGSMHTGIDIDGTTGQPIAASKSGTVVMASAYSGYGNAVIIDHGGGISTLYAHLSSFSVSNGQFVSQGQTVGAVGCTGSCTGDHLHFEVRVNGSPVDPLNYLP